MVQTEIRDIQTLFEDVQMGRVFPDGKTFVDCRPITPINEINARYEAEKGEPGFELKQFILDHFECPVHYSQDYESDPSKSVEENIESLWSALTRRPDKVGGTMIPLPYPYIVPGGRFGEIYYWDSYFTMLGLEVSGKHDMLENMVKNFSFLIDQLGYVPNGNRSYFVGRSQPPFYSLMVDLLAGIKGRGELARYLPQLRKEHQFWMKGSGEVSPDLPARFRCARLVEGEILNRYWDENNTPRPESFREDIELSRKTDRPAQEVFRDLRAGAESGWDYSCRWFKDKHSFATIHTTDIIPVDLNCLLMHLEETIAAGYASLEDESSARHFSRLAGSRRLAIQQYCWNGDKGFYFDYDFMEERQTEVGTLAAAFPLFFGIASEEQGRLVASQIREQFLKAGGLVATVESSGQQWDAPNGWAPLHWIAIIGLEKYGLHDLAKEIAKRWLKLNRDVFTRTGKLMEKYNVVDTHLEAGGGEYPGQDGFGWTNGVFLALAKKYELYLK